LPILFPVFIFAAYYNYRGASQGAATKGQILIFNEVYLWVDYQRERAFAATEAKNRADILPKSTGLFEMNWL
jgi:hypothetical protein